MKVEFRNSQIKKICTKKSIAEKKYGKEMAKKITMRMGQIKSASTVEYMIEKKIGRCHPLSLNRNGQYAMDLVHPKRLIFEKRENKIQIAEIIEIVDYH